VKRLLIAGALSIIAVLAAVSLVSSATGQAPGGTPGPKATGAFTVQVRLTEKNFFGHCSDTVSHRRCRRERNPKIGSLFGGNAPVFAGGAQVGRAYFQQIVTRRGKNGRDLFLATLQLADGQISVQGLSTHADEDSPPSAIVGGTGAYAGARGVESERFNEADSSKTVFAIDLTFTFIS
jgi:hypothetical protein